MAKPTDLMPGRLDLLILRTLALQPMHGWGIAQRIRQVSKDVLQVHSSDLNSRSGAIDGRPMSEYGMCRTLWQSRARQVQESCYPEFQEEFGKQFRAHKQQLE
jgi:hypothetical protein